MENVPEFQCKETQSQDCGRLAYGEEGYSTVQEKRTETK